MKITAIISLLISFVLLTACQAIHRHDESRQEAACWPGSQCWQQANPDKQALKRQEYVAARQSQLRQADSGATPATIAAQGR